MPELLIIKTGCTFADTARCHGDFEELFVRGLGISTGAIRVHEARDSVPLPDPERCDGVVITGAHSMVTDADEWIAGLQIWLRAAARTTAPVLGVCYGHQLIGQAFGGRSGPHPAGPEVGTVEITRTAAALDDPLFSNLPEHFPVHVTHHQSVLRLPAGAVVLAANDHDPHQAIRIGNNIWGVQFHPEFTAGVTEDYIDRQHDILTAWGQDPSALRKRVCDTPLSNALLGRFASICGFDTVPV